MLSLLLIMLFQVLKTPDSLGQLATFLAEVVKVGILNHHLLIRSRHITVPYESYRKQTQLAFFKTLWLLRRKSFGRSDWRPRWRPVDQLEEPCHCHKHYRLIMTTIFSKIILKEATAPLVGLAMWLEVWLEALEVLFNHLEDYNVMVQRRKTIAKDMTSRFQWRCLFFSEWFLVIVRW